MSNKKSGSSYKMSRHFGLKYYVLISAVIIIIIMFTIFSQIDYKTPQTNKNIQLNITYVSLNIYNSSDGSTQTINSVFANRSVNISAGIVEQIPVYLYAGSSSSLKVTSFSVNAPFKLVNSSPTTPVTIPPGKTLDFILYIKMPNTSYSGAIPITADVKAYNISGTIVNTSKLSNSSNTSSNSRQNNTSFPSCLNFNLSLTSAYSHVNGQCEWGGGDLNISYSTGLSVAISLNITNNLGYSYNLDANNSKSYPLYCLNNSQSTYLPAGTYSITLLTGAGGATCSNNEAYVQLNNNLKVSKHSATNTSLSSSNNSSSSANTPCHIAGANSSYYGTTVLAQTGQTCQLNPNYHEQLGFTTYGPTEIGGTFTVNNSLEVYVLNNQELLAYNSSGVISSYQCEIGTNIISGSLNCEVPAGNWSILLINNNQQPSEITFTSNITASYISYAEETPFTIVSQGTNWNLPGTDYRWQSFQLNSGALISGSFSSSSTVDGYIMNPSEYAAFQANGSTTSYYCTTGSVTSGSIGCELAAGTWYFVLDNPSNYSSVNVNWQSNLTAYGLSTTPYSDDPYDEQFGLTFANNFTILTYNVTAVAQEDTSDLGPAYLLNGLSNTGYWYQIGLAYNWPVYGGNQYTPGFQAIYEIFNSSGASISTGGSSLSMSGEINSGDTVTLSLYFSNGNVLLTAHDLNTGAYGSTSYNAEGADEFVGNPTSTATNGFFTGLMTEWYHAFPWYGPGNLVTYNPFGTISSPAWLWVDEFFCYGGSANCLSGRTTLFFNSTNNAVYPSYTFDSNAAQLNYLPGGEFTTGS